MNKHVSKVAAKTPAKAAAKEAKQTQIKTIIEKILVILNMIHVYSMQNSFESDTVIQCSDESIKTMVTKNVVKDKWSEFLTFEEIDFHQKTKKIQPKAKSGKISPFKKIRNSYAHKEDDDDQGYNNNSQKEEVYGGCPITDLGPLNTQGEHNCGGGIPSI